MATYPPLALLINPERLFQDAQSAGPSDDQVSFLANFSRIYPQYAGTNADGQVGGGCLTHYVVLNLPVPANHRRGYESDDNFNMTVFNDVVLGTIEADQQAGCQARMEEGNYFTCLVNPDLPEVGDAQGSVERVAMK